MRYMLLVVWCFLPWQLALAETFVIEVEALISDRLLNQQEQAILRESFQSAPGNRGDFIRDKTLKSLRGETNLNSTARIRFLLTENGVGYQQIQLKDAALEMQVQVVSADETRCKLKYSCMLAGKLLGPQGNGSSATSGQRDCNLDGQQQIVSNSGNAVMSRDGPVSGESRLLLLSARRATPEELAPLEIREDFGRMFMQNQQGNRKEALGKDAPRFLMLNAKWERLELVTPDRYADFESVSHLEQLLETRADQSLKKFKELLQLSDPQLEKIRATFTRHNAILQRDVHELEGRLLAEPRIPAIAMREVRDQISAVNYRVQADYTATDSLCWQVLKTQLTDSQKHALAEHCISEFIDDLKLGLSISVEQSGELTKFLTQLCEQQGGFALDDQVYWDALKAADPQVLERFLDATELKRLVQSAGFSNNVQAGLWNLQQSGN